MHIKYNIQHTQYRYMNFNNFALYLEGKGIPITGPGGSRNCLPDFETIYKEMW